MSDTPENKPEEQEQTDNTEVVSNDTDNSSGDSGNSFDINTVIEDAKKVILSPVEFYKNMPQTGGYANPLVFAVAMALATAVIFFVFSMIGLAKFNPIMAGIGGLSLLIMMPIGVIIGCFIGAAILFVIWKLMGSEKSYEVAFRCVAYSMAIMPVIAVISFIPYIANIVKTVWSCFLLYVASIHVHELKDQTAKIVFGVIAALLVFTGIGSERTARKWTSMADKYQKEYKRGSIGSALERLENADEMTPEEAGKEFGKFMKGLEEFSKGVEESTKEEKKD